MSRITLSVVAWFTDGDNVAKFLGTDPADQANALHFMPPGDDRMSAYGWRKLGPVTVTIEGVSDAKIKELVAWAHGKLDAQVAEIHKRAQEAIGHVENTRARLLQIEVRK